MINRENDVVITLHPITDENNNWDSDIAMSVTMNSDSKLNDDDLGTVIGIARIMVAALYYMEENTEYRDAVAEYMENNFIEDENGSVNFGTEDEQEEETTTNVKVKNIKGNVITVDFTPQGTA